MHLHPTVARLIVEIGRDYGMRAVRVPAEPVAALRRAFPNERSPRAALRPWTEALRRRLRRAGSLVNDHVFGLAWSGAMIEERVLRLVPHLPDGVSEIYFHPAAERSPRLVAAMPRYRHTEELAALLSPAVKGQIAEIRDQPRQLWRSRGVGLLRVRRRLLSLRQYRRRDGRLPRKFRSRDIKRTRFPFMLHIS